MRRAKWIQEKCDDRAGHVLPVLPNSQKAAAGSYRDQRAGI